jgi:hypothetical protein
MNTPINGRVKTNFFKLRNAEHFGICYASLIEPLAPLIPSVPTLVPAFQAMQAIFVRLDDLFKPMRKAVQTKELKRLHAYCHSLFAVFHRIIVSAAYSSDAGENKSAEALKPLLATYRDMRKATYAQQNGLISNLTEDCIGPVYGPAVTALGMDPLIARMATANGTFGSLIETRGINKVYFLSKGKLASVRREMDQAIDVLVTSVNSLYMLNEIGAGDPALKDDLLKIIAVINAAIQRVKHILTDRAARRASAKARAKAKTEAKTQAPAGNPKAMPPQAETMKAAEENAE